MPAASTVLTDLVRAERCFPRPAATTTPTWPVRARAPGWPDRGSSWAEAVTDRILSPLGLMSVSTAPTERADRGLSVDVVI